MLNFLDLGLLNGNYVFIIVYLFKWWVFMFVKWNLMGLGICYLLWCYYVNFSFYIGNNMWMGNDGRDNDVKKVYEGVLNIE